MTDCRILWPKDPDRQLWLWGALAGKLGCEYPVPRPFLIGVRGVKLFGEESHDTRSRVEYDDAFCLLPPGQRPVFFTGSSHAFQLFSKLATDSSGDGVGDVATIDPGSYVLTWKMDDAAKCPVFELTTTAGDKRIPCHRDEDHDGVAEVGGLTATAILFHTGFDAPVGAAHASSIGCQCTSANNLRMMKAAGHVIDYRLVNAFSLATLAGELPAWDDETEPQA